MTTNDQFAGAVTRAGTALAGLPIAELPPLAAFDVRVGAHDVHVEASIEPMDRSAVGVLDAVLAWASVLPEASLHAREESTAPGSWRIAVRGELGGVATEIACVTAEVPLEITRVVRQAPNPWTAATSLVHAMVVDTASGGHRRTASRR